MSLREWFRNVFSGPSRVADTGDEGAEIDAAMAEESGAPTEVPADVMPPAPTAPGGLGPGIPGTGAVAEAAEAEVESEEPPPEA